MNKYSTQYENISKLISSTHELNRPVYLCVFPSFVDYVLIEQYKQGLFTRVYVQIRLM